MNLSQAVFTNHALGQMAKRQIAPADVRGMLAAPEQVLPVRPGRVVAQGMVGRLLLRVFVDVNRSPPEVVTAYRTSTIQRYRRQT